MTQKTKLIIGILGAGAWGKALAFRFADDAHQIILWGRNVAGLYDEVPSNIQITDQLRDLAQCQLVLSVIAAKGTEAVWARAKHHIHHDAVILSCSKGLTDSYKFMSELIAQHCPENMCGALSGPSFASDVSANRPTAITLALPDIDKALYYIEVLSSRVLRCYGSDDVLGVELGGAMKNVIAIAAGMVTGLGLGASAHAALITRGFAEMQRMGQALGANPSTLNGLSGLGDLLLTASNEQSRNYSFGKEIGETHSSNGDAGVKELLSKAGTQLVEGRFAAPLLLQIGMLKQIELPIISAVNLILSQEKTIDQTIGVLLSRPTKIEFTFRG